MGYAARDVVIHLTHDEALILSELLHHWENQDRVTQPEHHADQIAGEAETHEDHPVRREIPVPGQADAQRKALVATGNSLLTIYIGAGYYERQAGIRRQARNHLRDLWDSSRTRPGGR